MPIWSHSSFDSNANRIWMRSATKRISFWLTLTLRAHCFVFASVSMTIQLWIRHWTKQPKRIKILLHLNNSKKRSLHNCWKTNLLQFQWTKLLKNRPLNKFHLANSTTPKFSYPNVYSVYLPTTHSSLSTRKSFALWWILWKCNDSWFINTT